MARKGSQNIVTFSGFLVCIIFLTQTQSWLLVSTSPVKGESPTITNTILKSRTSISTTDINPGSHPHSSHSYEKKRVVLTNVKRQIGNSSPNPILNLHEKVNGQGERGGQGLNVTDVSSEFRRKTLFKSNISEETSSENNTATAETVTDTTTISSNTTTSHPEVDGKHSQNVNLNWNSSTSNGYHESSRTESFTIIRTADPAPNPLSLLLSQNESDVDGGRLIRRRYNKSSSVNDVYNSQKSVGVSVTEGNDNETLPTTLTQSNLSRTGNDLRGQKGSCTPVIVNQTFSNSSLNDMKDKWTRTLVKISQCIADCIGLSPASSHNNNMSPKKGTMNEGGGAESPPFGISLAILNTRNVINEKSNENKMKLLSSCQKSCKFLPLKSTISTQGAGVGPSTPPRKKNGSEETNKREKEDEKIKNPIPGAIATSPTPIIPVKRDDFSSSNSNSNIIPGLEITRSDKGVFHLLWPKITSPTKMPIVYTVIFQAPGNRLGGVHRWKLIDQTVVLQTQISLVDHACQNLGEPQGENTTYFFPTFYTHNHEEEDIRRIQVMAVNSQGLVKLFSAQVSCSCLGPVDQKKNENNFPTTGNEIRHQSSSFFDVFDENSNKISLANPLKKVKDIIEKKAIEKESEELNKPKENSNSRSNEIPGSKSLFFSSSAISSWSLRMVSMVYQDSLVMTEVAWELPSEISNQNDVTVTSKSSTRDGFGDERKNQKYHFLLTWEIFGGGLRGNLVTDTNTTSGSISLWPDTAYFIQVGLINTETPNLSSSPPSKQTNNPSIKEEQPKEGVSRDPNYLNNLEDESIIFPLTDLEPKVTLRSERLLVNTSQVSIPSSLSSSLSSTTSLRSESESKSNNAMLQQQERSGSKTSYSLRGWSKNVSKIVIFPTSTNGNENDHQSKNDDEVGLKRVGVDLLKHRNHFSVQQSRKSNGNNNGGGGRSRSKYQDRHHLYHYHKHAEGYLGDSPEAPISSYVHYEEEAKRVHSYHNTSGKNGTNGYEDKKSNINDNKSNNNLKPKITFTSAASPVDQQTIYRPDVYQDLFALNSESTFRTVPISGVSKEQSHDFANYNGSNSFGLDSEMRPSAMYSVFVLVVVACVIFLFLVAFIGFFVVTSSISKTAQYFVPKRMRVWIVGRNEEELLRARDRDEEVEEEDEFYGTSYDEVDDNDGSDWNGVEVTSNREETQQIRT